MTASLEAFLARWKGQRYDSPDHTHPGVDIEGPFINVTLSGDLWSTNWNGGVPGNLAAGAIAAASSGFYLDSSAGAAQFEALYADNAVISGSLTAGIGSVLPWTYLTGVEILPADLADGYRLPGVGAALPVAGMIEGDLFFLTTDGKLYRYHSAAWTAAVPTVDLAGTITTLQIADAAINNAKLALAAVQGVNIAATTITGGNIVGLTITGDQIAGTTITGAKIAALTIEAGNIKAGAITATKLGVDSVEAGAIKAGAVTAGKISVTNLQAVSASTGTLTVTSTLTMGTGGSSGYIQSADYGVGLGWQLGPTGLTINQGTIHAAALLIDSSITLGAAGYIQSNDFDATHGWQLGPTGLTVNVGTIKGAAIAAGTITADRLTVSQLSLIAGSMGTLSINSSLTFVSGGALYSNTNMTIGGLNAGIELATIARDRFKFYAGTAAETSLAAIWAEKGTDQPRLHLKGTGTAGGAGAEIDLFDDDIILTAEDTIRLIAPSVTADRGDGTLVEIAPAGTLITGSTYSNTTGAWPITATPAVITGTTPPTVDVAVDYAGQSVLVDVTISAVAAGVAAGDWWYVRPWVEGSIEGTVMYEEAVGAGAAAAHGAHDAHNSLGGHTHDAVGSHYHTLGYTGNYSCSVIHNHTLPDTGYAGGHTHDAGGAHAHTTHATHADHPAHEHVVTYNGVTTQRWVGVATAGADGKITLTVYGRTQYSDATINRVTIAYMIYRR